MKLTQPLLATLLVGQLLLVGVLLFQAKSNATVRPDSALVEFDIQSIDRLSIEDKESSVVLKRVSDAWQLEESAVPVNSARIDTLLENLTAARTGWAVATRDESHRQLEVAEDSFNRKVSLFANDEEVASLFVGTSPGLRRSHARVAGSDEVYSVALNDYDIPGNRSDWIETDIVTVDSVEQFMIANYTVVADGAGWKVTSGDGEDSEGDKDAIEEFTQQLKNLRVLDVADSIPEEAVPVALQVGSGDHQLTYEFVSDDDNYYVSRSDNDNSFKISQSAYNAIADVDPTSFLSAFEEEISAGNDTSNENLDSQLDDGTETAD